jgi:hypothetical protein
MATDIGFLASGPIELGLGLDLGIRDYENHGETLAIIFRCTHFTIVESVAIALLSNC